MAGAAEIRARIQGITDTKKITDAMYMISSAKMRRALRSREQSKPYFDALAQKIGALLCYIPKTQNRYFRIVVPEDRPHSTHGILLITSDKGLAGGYNQEAIRLCEAYRARHPKTVLFTVGEYGRQYFMSHHIPVVRTFHYAASYPHLTDARVICAELLTRYCEAEVDEINVIYTNYMGAKPGVCLKRTLLPLEKTRFHEEIDGAFAVPDSERARMDQEAIRTEKEFLPGPDEVLNGIVPEYLMGFVYGCLVESFCSEQQARMTAMKSAGDHAAHMLRDLKIQYHKIRQAAITNEMIEVTAGAKAQSGR